MANLTDIITPTNLVTKTGTDTLTNKTLTSPIVTNLSASGTFTLGGSAVTSTAAELNLVDGSAAGTIANSKALIYGSSGEVNATTFQIAGASITSTAAELNVLDGIPAGLTATELGYVDGVTSAIQTQIDSISPSPTYEATASGTLANGDTVIVNADGTVSAVAGTGATQSLGADSEFESGGITGVQGCYDTAADRVVITYKEATDGYVVAAVGQVSGTSITWGAETRIGSQNSGYSDIAYDVNANRVVVTYREPSPNTDHLYAAVGTVTGGGTNTVSFGTTVAVKSSNVRDAGIVYLAATNKMVILWYLNGGTYYAQAVCGTTDASGETITFGTEVTVNTGRSWAVGDRGAFYDPDTERVITCFTDYNASENGKAVVIENTTGTTLTVGAEAEFNAADTEYIAATYDTDQNKGIVMFRDKGDSSYLKAVVLTITGGVTNTITLGTEVTVVSASVTHLAAGFDQTANKTVVLYNNVSGTGDVASGTISGTGASATSTWDTPLSLAIAYVTYPDVVYDPDAAQSILCYVDGGDSESGHARALTVGYGSTNLTTENYIGISNGAYADGVTATIQVVGSVDDAQTSLTAGQTYYISFDGSLSLTPLDDPAVTAGTAVTATKLIVKG